MVDSPHGDDRYCSNCGERMTRQANYCHYCGEQLRHRQAGGSGPGDGRDTTGGHPDDDRGGDSRAETGARPRANQANGGQDTWSQSQQTATGGPAAGTAGLPDDLLPDESPFRAVGVAAGLGILGIVGLAIVSVLVGGILGLLGASTGVLLVVGTAIGQYIGFGGVALGYLRNRGFTWDAVRSYLGVRVPTLREFAVVAAGYVAIIVLLIVVAGIASVFLPEPAENQAVDTTENNRAIIPAMILMMFLVVGPMEELLFRGVVQNRIREHLPAAPTIAIASLIFAAVHVVALAGNLTGMLVTVFILFFPATVFGAVYEYTGNIVVPALLHAIHNSVIVTLIFFAPEMEEAETILAVLAALPPL